jgi:hypothetical protein
MQTYKIMAKQDICVELVEFVKTIADWETKDIVDENISLLAIRRNARTLVAKMDQPKDDRISRTEKNSVKQAIRDGAKGNSNV